MKKKNRRSKKWLLANKMLTNKEAYAGITPFDSHGWVKTHPGPDPTLLARILSVFNNSFK